MTYLVVSRLLMRCHVVRGGELPQVYKPALGGHFPEISAKTWPANADEPATPLIDHKVQT